MIPEIDRARLLAAIREGYVLRWDGLHGVSHWERVEENGLKLAESNGARTDVVRLFALLHDARRENDGFDADHGRRGAALGIALRGDAFEIDDPGMELLVEACSRHTNGAISLDPTVGACWDADRLDLPRCGIRPVPSLLCTVAARDPEVLEWARLRAVR